MIEVSLNHDAPPLDLDLKIKSNQTTALVGPSGSGKTSILRAIAGLLKTQRSCIKVDKTIWSDSDQGVWRATANRTLGYVCQNYALFPHLTALQNVESALLHLPESERRKQAMESLEKACIAGLEDRLPANLSGGQRQRVAMARAIARRPSVLLLDEPFSALDRSTAKRLYIELNQLFLELRTTVILVTHDLDEAAQLAEHLCLIHHGRQVQYGATNEMLRRPTSVEAAQLLDFKNIIRTSCTASNRETSNSQIQWGDLLLEVENAPTLSPNSPLFWTVRPSDVTLVRADGKNTSELGNLLHAIVDELVLLREWAVVTLKVVNGGPERLQMQLRPSALSRHQVRIGAKIQIAIHPSVIIILDE